MPAAIIFVVVMRAEGESGRGGELRGRVLLGMLVEIVVGGEEAESRCWWWWRGGWSARGGDEAVRARGLDYGLLAVILAMEFWEGE